MPNFSLAFLGAAKDSILFHKVLTAERDIGFAIKFTLKAASSGWANPSLMHSAKVASVRTLILVNLPSANSSRQPGCIGKIGYP